jgi:hypothetical protein
VIIGRVHGNGGLRLLVLGATLLDLGREINNRKRAFRPIVLPADDELASGWVMFVPLKLTTPKLELDSDTFEGTVLAAELGVAVGKATLDTLDDKPEIACQHAEEEHDALLVDGRVA